MTINKCVLCEQKIEKYIQYMINNGISNNIKALLDKSESKIGKKLYGYDYDILSLLNGFRNLCDNEVCLKKSFSSHSIEGIMYRENCDLEEAEKIFKEQSEKMLVQRKITNDQLRSEDPLWDKKRSRNCPEFWINKGLSEEVQII